MLEILKRADNILIDVVFQPYVHRIAQALRIDCFQQARICTTIAAVVWIIPQTQAIAAAVRSKFVVLYVFQGSLLLLVLGAIAVLHALFQRQAGGVHNWTNPLRASMLTHRIVALLGLTTNMVQVAFGPVSWSYLALGVCVTAAGYVGACSHPPPKPREQKGNAWGWQLKNTAAPGGLI